MNINSFRELLLKKAQGNQNLELLIKHSADEFLSEQIVESLKKMAEDIRRPRSSNPIIKHFGDVSMDEHMVNMIRDALGHHASHYKAAVKAGKTGSGSTAAKHMKAIHDIMHLSRKLHKDSIRDHSRGQLKIEAVDPKPWERTAYMTPGKKAGALSDTKGWSRLHPSYDYMSKTPSNIGSYGKEVERHGHKGAYPLEEIKVNGKYIHIDDVDPEELKDYTPHELDEHPLFKPLDMSDRTLSKLAAFRIPPSKLKEHHYDLYTNALEDYEDSGHVDKWFDRHEQLQTADPEGYGKRGSERGKPVHETITPHAKDSLAIGSVFDDPTTKLDESEPPAIPKAEVPKAEPVKPITAYTEGIDTSKITPEVKAAMGLDDDIEKSLKTLKDILVKNAEFLSENPDILAAIEERLLKADPSDDEGADADAWLREFDPDYQEGQYDEDDEENPYADDDYADSDEGLVGLFDNPEEADDYYDDEDKDLVINEQGMPEYVDITQPDSPAEEAQGKENLAPAPEKKKRLTGYTAWAPREDYSPEERAKIEAFVKEGYHPGDAEILAGAHRGPTNILDAVRSRVHPHEMSELMHGRLRDIAEAHMKGVVAGEYKYADPSVNPQMASAGKGVDLHEEAIQDFHTEKQKLFDSDEYKNMTPRQQRAALKEFRREWSKQNPDYKDKMRGAWQQIGDTHRENWGEREKKLIEGMKAVTEAGQAHVDDTPQGPGTTEQAAYQSAGGVTEGDKPTGVTTVKDPHVTLAEQYPELKEKYAQKLKSKLSPERMERMNRLKGAKGPNNE